MKIESYPINVDKVILATSDLIHHRSGLREETKLVTKSMKE